MVVIALDLLKLGSLAALFTSAGIPTLTVRRAGATFEAVYSPQATPQQIAAGNALIASFDASDAAERARQDAAHPDKAAIRSQAASAIQANNDFLALGQAVTLAQAVAQIRALTRQSNVVMRRLIQLSEGLA